MRRQIAFVVTVLLSSLVFGQQFQSQLQNAYTAGARPNSLNVPAGTPPNTSNTMGTPAATPPTNCVPNGNKLDPNSCSNPLGKCGPNSTNCGYNENYKVNPPAKSP